MAIVPVPTCKLNIHAHNYIPKVLEPGQLVPIKQGNNVDVHHALCFVKYFVFFGLEYF